MQSDSKWDILIKQMSLITHEGINQGPGFHTHAHTRTRTHTHTHAHARTRARTHTRAHEHTHSQTQRFARTHLTVHLEEWKLTGSHFPKKEKWTFLHVLIREKAKKEVYVRENGYEEFPNLWTWATRHFQVNILWFSWSLKFQYKEINYKIITFHQ